MEIVVLAKLVPDSESRIELKDGIVDGNGFDYIVNPFDEFAIEQAVQLKEKNGGKVTLVTLFDEKGGDMRLKKALAIGADELICLRQANYRGDAPVANAKVLAEAVKGMNPDIVLAGVQAIDFYQSATGPMVAQLLGIPNVSSVTKLTEDNGTFTLHRQIEGGRQVVTAQAPLLITAQKDMVKVRFPNVKDIMGARKKPFENREVTTESGDLLPSSYEMPPARGGGKVIGGDDSNAKITELVRLLKEEAKVL